MEAVTRSRRLTDLYDSGKEVPLSNPQKPDEPPLVVWVSKLTRPQQRDVVEKANIARAKHMAIKYRGVDSDGRLNLETRAYLLGMFDSREDMLPVVIAKDLNKAQESFVAEISSHDEWADKEYFEGLKAAWFGDGGPEDGLQYRYKQILAGTEPEDDEVARVLAELQRFDAQVQEKVDIEEENLGSEMNGKTDTELRAMVVDALVEAEASDVWSSENQRWRVYYGTRELERHAQLYFESVDEVDLAPEDVLTELQQAIAEVTVGALEVKD